MGGVFSNVEIAGRDLSFSCFYFGVSLGKMFSSRNHLSIEFNGTHATGSVHGCGPGALWIGALQPAGIIGRQRHSHSNELVDYFALCTQVGITIPIACRVARRKTTSRQSLRTKGISKSGSQ